MSRKKRKSKRSNKNSASCSLSEDETQRQQDEHSQPTASASPVDEDRLVKTLSQREPEQFGYYDSASDKSEDEGEKDELLRSVEDSRKPRKGARSNLLETFEDELDVDHPKDDSPQIESDVEPDESHDMEPATGNGCEPEVDGVHSDQKPDNQDVDKPSRQQSTRYPCPHATEYECDATFASKNIADRHGKSHSTSLACPVCEKVLHRQDSYDRHLKRHSVHEFAEADLDVDDTAQAAEGSNGSKEPDKGSEAGEADDADLDPEEAESPRKRLYPCPRAGSLDCDKTYSNPKAANQHAKSHTSDLSCPLGCVDPKTQTVMAFATEGTRKRHLEKQHTREERSRAKSLQQNASGQATEASPENTQQEEQVRDAEDVRGIAERGTYVATMNGARMLGQPEDEGPSIDDDYAGDHITADPEIPSARGPGENGAASDVEREASLPDGPRSMPTEHPPASKSKKRKRPDEIMLPTTDRKTSAKKRKKKQSEEAASPLHHAEWNGSMKGGKFVGVYIDTPEEPPTKRRQSTISTFAQPYAAGSKLRHPLFHPESPEKRKRPDVESSDLENEPRNNKRLASTTKRRTEEPTRRESLKGKERASSDDEEGNQEDGPPMNGLMSTVAQRRLQASTAKAKSSPRRNTFDLDDSDEDFDDDAEPDEETRGHKGLNVAKGIICRICKRSFKNQSRLNIHMNKPKSHRNLLQCDECHEKFYHIGALNKHKKASGHGQVAEDEGAGGRFTERELAAIRRWVKSFRLEHDLTEDGFREVMQASFRVGQEWRYKFMSKQEFNDEYFDVLPHRSKQSMRRYRNWNFNTEDTSNIWSREEDDEIIRLREELGPRWNRIGREINRPGEMVRKRYQFKLQTANMQHGFWTKPEEDAFRDAIEEVKAISDSTAETFNWTAVSQIMQTRTPQQCSNHWRAKYIGRKKGDKWLSPGDETPLTMAKSKMEARLAGNLKSSPRRNRVVSKAYVKESEDEEDTKASNNEDPHKGSSKSRKSTATRSKSTRKTAKSEDEDEEEEEDIMGPPDSASEKEDRNEEDIMRPPPASASEEDDDDDDDDSNLQQDPKLPQNRTTDMTSGKTLTASQAFNQTQANTSAKRFSARKGSAGPSQERPSPIAIQRRREQSPELGTPDSELQVDEDGADAKATTNESVLDSDDDDKEELPQNDGQLDSESVPDPSEPGGGAHQIEMPLFDDQAEESSGSESDDDDEDGSTESESEADSESESTGYETGASKQASISASASRAQTLSNDESESESGSSSESEAESESEPTSPPPDQKPAPSNKGLAKVANSFMDSIHEASQKRKQRTPVAKWVDSDESESDDDDGVPSQTLPVMRRR